MNKVFAVVIISVLLGGGGYSHSSGYTQDKSEVLMCHLLDKDAKSASISKVIVADGQDSQQQPPSNPPQNPPQDPQQPTPPQPKPEEDPDYQPDDTATHRSSPGEGCSRANPSAEPGDKLNGVKKNTVGCVCKRTCVNGQTQEDLSRGANGKYICKNACHK